METIPQNGSLIDFSFNVTAWAYSDENDKDSHHQERTMSGRKAFDDCLRPLPGPSSRSKVSGQKEARPSRDINGHVRANASSSGGSEVAIDSRTMQSAVATAARTGSLEAILKIINNTVVHSIHSCLLR